MRCGLAAASARTGVSVALAPALFVHPHPDDESISCGGVIAAEVARGRPVTIVTCTGGEAGDNQSGIDLGGREMPEVRRAEMEAAIEALGSPEHRWLGYWDTGMDVDEDGRPIAPEVQHENSFDRADLDEAARRLAGMIRELRPAVVVSDDESGTYGHPDHVKANRVTARAVALAADPDWDEGVPWRVARRVHHTISHGRMISAHNGILAAGAASPFGTDPIPEGSPLPMGVPDDVVTTAVDISDHLDVKRRAMAAHGSQIGPDSFFMNVPDEFARQMFGTEEFVIVEGRRAPGDDRDLFAGLDR